MKKSFFMRDRVKPVVNYARKLLEDLKELGIPEHIAKEKVAQHQLEPGLKDAAELTNEDISIRSRRRRNVES